MPSYCVKPYIYFVTSMVLLLDAGTLTNGQQQFLRFWNTSGCLGDPFQSFTDSGVKSISLGRIQLYSRANGLWKVELCERTGCPTSIRAGVDDGCAEHDMSYDFTFFQVTRFGDADQSERKIVFFQDINFSGRSWSTNETGLYLTPSKRAYSYYFTGLNTWQIKAGEDAEDWICLNYSKTVGNNGYGNTYGKSLTTASAIEVGKVTWGCDGNVVTEVITDSD